MTALYDMCVDYDTLCELQHKLDLVAHNLTNSAEQMTRTIQNSQEFLAGNQFEEAKRITETCVSMVERTYNNIEHAKEYLEKLITVLEDYGQSAYKGGSK